MTWRRVTAVGDSPTGGKIRCSLECGHEKFSDPIGDRTEVKAALLRNNVSCPTCLPPERRAG